MKTGKELSPEQMGTNTRGNGRMGKGLVKEHSLGLIVESTRGNGRMEKGMSMGHTLTEKGNGKETNMKENGRMEKGMGMEHTLGLMESSLLGNGRVIKYGTEQNTTKTEILNLRL